MLLEGFELISELSAGAQMLLIACTFVLCMYLLTLIAFSRTMTHHLERLIRVWQHVSHDVRKKSMHSSQRKY